MKREGRTILFVTHDMSSVERFCDRAMLLERGRGGADRAARRGRAPLQRAQLRSHRAGAEPAGDGAPRGARITGAWCEDESGERVVSARAGRLAAAPASRWSSIEAIEDPLFAITFRNDVRHTIFVATSAKHGPQGSFGAGERGDRSLRVPQLARAQPLHAHPFGVRGPAGARGRAQPTTSTALIVEGSDGHRRRGRPAHRAGGGARVSAQGCAPRATAGPRRSATTCVASGASPTRSRSPTSSCASSARRSATCGRWSGRCCCSACSTSSSPRS